MTSIADRLADTADPAGTSGYAEHPPRMGFFTDTSVCIGCKACEVACKEWNHVPEDGLVFTGMSYDNSAGLGADTWRHVAFIEQRKPLGGQEPGTAGDLRWLMASDVCKHCTHAACLDVCPTGALFRTEFGTVVVQEDVCNGCGYCIPACPYGVIDQRKGDGRAWKCTLCYDRLSTGMEPACAKACPTDSIQFGPLDELRERAAARVTDLHAAGVTDARLYGESPGDGVGGDGAFFLLLDEPEVYGLPPDPVVTTRDLPAMWRHVGAAAATLAAVAVAAFAAALPGMARGLGEAWMSRDRGQAAKTLRRRAAVARDGIQDPRPGREAVTGAQPARRRRPGRQARRGEQLMVPPAEFTSYYGKPVLNAPVWEARDIAGYLFLGGLAGGSALLGAGAQLTGRPALARAAKAGSFGAGCLSAVALVHDLGRPARFLNMLRTVKVTSPMSIGSWLLAGFVPAAGVAAACALTGRLPRLGATATAGSALLGPAVAAYTAALISDTAVPAWHDGHREMPFVFTGSAAMAAGGLGLLAAPLSESRPARNLALAGLAVEASAFERMRRQMGVMVAEPYHAGRGGAYIRAGQALSAAAAIGAVLGGRSRAVSALSGAAFMAASAATRWGVFHAGLASANDPKYTVIPQRERLKARQSRAVEGSGQNARAGPDPGA